MRDSRPLPDAASASQAPPTPEEGVIKFSVAHRAQPVPARHEALARELLAWRRVLLSLGMIGREPHLYAGAGYGNVSARVGPPSSPMGRRAMLITGTQTGGLPELGIEDLCLIERYDYRDNRVWSTGLIEPSSETMTHGAIYDLSPHIRFAFHGHCAPIWQRARRLGIPQTRPEIAYGTPEMAAEMRRLYQSTGLPEQRVLAMGGHEDGIVAFGHTAEQAGLVLVAQLARAYAAE
ncbi:class II aldolase/adducin family protein [Haliangium ochraceum]|uniref:Class II aldolase/adducin family protein n=1 Tax=Haliangium ochraceum (strain DSM 14365 / JCM 11303 / SMP-2) TaxID=502025 RepID=D0LQ22_HALO1|nr:class II aldolase/adducin family protein [Haliangium ochraceum]ACY17059.1 class II aldolase/adducin family protein [Haliangium ochraceum DSM 14365]